MLQLLRLSSSFFFPSILPTLPISLTTGQLLYTRTGHTMYEIQHGGRSDNAFEITYQAVKTHEGGQRFCGLYHKYSRISPLSVSVEILAQWHMRYSEVFHCNMTYVTDTEKILLLQQRFYSVDRAPFFNFLLPQKPSYLPFSNAAQLMSTAFVDNTCILIDQLPYLSATKRRDPDIVEYAGVVNKLCTGFRDYSQSEQQFYCLVFVPDLRSEVSTQILLTLLHLLINTSTACRILANKAEEEGKTSNHFHYTKQANGLWTPLHVSANLRTFITALINCQPVKFQLRHFHFIVSSGEETR